jgi:hypothetical protein
LKSARRFNITGAYVSIVYNARLYLTTKVAIAQKRLHDLEAAERAGKIDLEKGLQLWSQLPGVTIEEYVDGLAARPETQE